MSARSRDHSPTRPTSSAPRRGWPPRRRIRRGSGRGSTGSASAGWSPRADGRRPSSPVGWWLLRTAGAADRGRPAVRHARRRRRRRRAPVDDRRRPPTPPAAPPATRRRARRRCRRQPRRLRAAGRRAGDAGLAAAGGRDRRRRRRRAQPRRTARRRHRIYVPVVGEAVAADRPGRPPRRGPSRAAGPVDLNQATAAELDALPGHRPGHGAAIVDHRTRTGRSPRSTTSRRSAASARPSSTPSARW